ncbi:adoMet dependent proline di-methyltransferase domain-containing protein [Sarocladium implicatum]|nr:adoMet dependent proline di-methyltransferase domain-containing protein [Sarocladium implicatum]
MASEHRDKQLQYWQGASADVAGMLGGVTNIKGFSSVSRIDLQGSRTFLARLGIGLKSDRKTVKVALDAGAGIGRITENLLLKVASEVDVVEPVEKLTDAIKGKPGVRNIFNVGLENWRPGEDAAYDLIWTQWCLCYLTEEQIVDYLKVCKDALSSTGVIVVKENLSTTGDNFFDETDSSTTREDEKYQSLFKKAGLRLIKNEPQRGLPETPGRRLFPVRMYALRP